MHFSVRAALQDIKICYTSSIASLQLKSTFHVYVYEGTEGLLEYEPRLRAESVDLHTLKELEVDDMKHFGIPVGPARRIVNVLRRHRDDDLAVVVRAMKAQVSASSNQTALASSLSSLASWLANAAFFS